MEPSPDGGVSVQIIGVVRDFHFESLHQEIRPMLFRFRDFARYVVVRIAPEDVQQTIAMVEDRWRTATSGEPFEYSFLDEDFENLHRGDRKMGEIFTGFSALAILIACLGLYGLAAFTIQQRTKEIGVRKTLGASTSNLIMLMSRECIVLVLIALVVATPLAYFAISQWLQLFSYRIDMSPAPFIASGVLALIIAFVTVSLQSMKTALTNPALTLRDE
ncbi:MAG: FtsX-like permease family protein [Pseudomonadales bacterium]|nr:FtsX-like permease family protein [Pseudomonadales bacterium]